MGRSFVREPLIFLLFLTGCLALPKRIEVIDDGSVIQVNLTKPRSTTPYIKQISILPSSNVILNVTDISSNVAFYIVQIHAYVHSVMMSYDKNYKNKVYGSNIGLYVKPSSDKISQLFLKNDGAHTVKAMLVIINYNQYAPIPGGCNMEFETEIAPYAMVYTEATMITVDVQPASMPLIKNATPICDKNPVSIEMYRMFLPEQDRTVDTYFSSITTMLTVEDILQNGQQITSSVVSTPMRRVFAAYTGTGSVYVAVATYGNYSAAYVPGFSYGCNPLGGPDSCQVLNDGYSKFVCACCFFLGLFSVFCGGKCLVFNRQLPMFFVATVIGYIVAGQDITLAWVIGIATAVIWGLCIHKVPFFNYLFPLPLSLFFTSVAYFRSPESFIFLQTDWVFWTLFVVMTLTVGAIKFLLYLFTRGTISCAIFGSFMMILPIDYYAGSALKYIIINVVRRCTVADFGLAIVQPPVQTKDITLIVFWTLLAVWSCLRNYCTIPSINMERIPLLSRIRDNPPDQSDVRNDLGPYYSIKERYTE